MADSYIKMMYGMYKSPSPLLIESLTGLGMRRLDL